MTLNMTALLNASSDGGVAALTCVTNSGSDGALVTGFIVAVFFIMLLVMKKWEFEKGLLVASWSCFLLSAIASSVPCPGNEGLTSLYVALVFLTIAAFTSIYVWQQDY